MNKMEVYMCRTVTKRPLSRGCKLLVKYGYAKLYKIF